MLGSLRVVVLRRFTKMVELKDVTEKLYERAKKEHIQFPKRWKDVTVKRACGATLMLKSDPTGFDEKAALDYLKQKYGTNPKKEASGRSKNDSMKTAEMKRETRYHHRNREQEPIHGGGNKDTSPDFSPARYEIVAVEENRPLVEAIKEMGAVHYKLNEPKKGTAYMRAVKLLRQCKHVIKDKESARELAGVGPAMADHVDEFLRTGDVQHWEEGRARLRKGEGKK